MGAELSSRRSFDTGEQDRARAEQSDAEAQQQLLSDPEAVLRYATEERMRAAASALEAFSWGSEPTSPPPPMMRRQPNAANPNPSP